MKSLYLLRHAHALAEAPPSSGDHERTLSDQGAIEAKKVADFMQQKELRPDLILSSSAVRTIQTTRIIIGSAFSSVGIRISTQFDRNLYLAEPSAIIENIRGTNDEFKNLLVVGHNPGMGDLARHFSDDAVHEFPTAALAVFSCDAETWHDFDTGRMTLQQVLLPGQ